MLDIPTFLNVLGTVVVLMLPVAAVLWAAWRTVADWMADPPVDSGSVDEVDDTPAGRHSPDQRRSRNRRGGSGLTPFVSTVESLRPTPAKHGSILGGDVSDPVS